MVQWTGHGRPIWVERNTGKQRSKFVLVDIALTIICLPVVRFPLFIVCMIKLLKSMACTHTGVVDAYLKVYNTANLCVVDASILPLQLSAHLSSSLYGVAKKVADLIKADQ